MKKRTVKKKLEDKNFISNFVSQKEKKKKKRMVLNIIKFYEDKLK